LPKKIIAFILTHNCGHMLEKAYKKIPKNLVYRIIVSDDLSSDNANLVAKKLGLDFFTNPGFKGYGGNIKSAIKKSFELGADYAVEIHGDGAQFDPIAIRDAIKYIDTDYDLILGSRFIIKGLARKNGMPLIRYYANIGLSFFDRIVLNLPLTEFHTGFRVYSKNFYETLPIIKNSNDYLFSFEVIAQASYFNLKVAEVPVEADYHSEHTSHSILGASVYAIKTFYILLIYLLAKFKIYYSPIFPKKHS